MALLTAARIFGPREPCRCGLSRTTLALTTTRRARKRPAESLCHPPSWPRRGSEATTFAPRPRALNWPVLPPSRPPSDRGPEPIRRGSPPALRTATWTCLRNGCVRRLMRAPARSDPEILALITCHDATIDIETSPHKSRQASIASHRINAHDGKRTAGLLLRAHCERHRSAD